MSGQADGTIDSDLAIKPSGLREGWGSKTTLRSPYSTFHPGFHTGRDLHRTDRLRGGGRDAVRDDLRCVHFLLSYGSCLKMTKGQ